MLETMYTNNGVGLAANQVGITKQIVIIDVSPSEEPKIYVLINPEILEYSADSVEYEEGCLSFPGIHETLKRPSKIKVIFQDLKGKKHELEAEGLLAVAVQHETDHLNGKLFIDKMSPVKRMLHNKELREIKKQSKEKS